MAVRNPKEEQKVNQRTQNESIMTTRMSVIKTGDSIKFRNDHGVMMVGEVIDKSEEAARVWTPIAVYIVSPEQVVCRIPKKGDLILIS